MSHTASTSPQDPTAQAEPTQAATQPLVAPYALDHVNLHVRDLERSLRFYEGLLGLPPATVLSRDGAGRPAFVELRVGQQLIFLRHRPEYAPPDASHAKGLNHLCLLIQRTDPDHLMAALRTHGVPITGTRGQPSGPTFSVYVSDPDGHGVELEQRK